MDAKECSIQEVFGHDQYIVPVFQRNYTWVKNNWDQLWEDLEYLLQNPNEKHFLGSIVLMPWQTSACSMKKFLIIDGQQRLTTISLLLCALRDVVEDASLKERIESTTLIHKFYEGGDKYKLYLRSRDRPSYEEILKGENYGKTPVGKAYGFFFNKLAKCGYNLTDLFHAIARRIEVVAITLKEESPYKIFKSLNSTGVDLKECDLIRNHVFMSIDIDHQNYFEDEHWKKLESHFHKDSKLDGDALSLFFRDILHIQGVHPPKKDIYTAFSKKYRNPDPIPFVQELEFYAKLYKKVLIPEEGPLELHLETLSILQNSHYGVLLSLFSLREKGEITEKELLSAVQALSSFIMRRKICGLNTRAYNTWFNKLCDLLAENRLPEVMVFLSERTPSDDEIEGAIAFYNAYKNKKFARIILSGIEKSMQNKDECIALDKCEIEHIMPQTLSSSWRVSTEDHGSCVHTFGNLTLLGQEYNQKGGNLGFDVKKHMLQTSILHMNRYFDNIQQWDAGSIIDRSQWVSQKIKEIWPAQSLPSS